MISHDVPQKRQKVFRLLKQEEFEALSRDERIAYIRDALQALKAWRRLDLPPARARKH